MPCNESLRVQAYFDGELDAAAAVDVECHLQSCAECAALLRDLEQTRKLVRTSAAYHRVNHDLRNKIAGRIGTDGEGRRRTARWFAPDRRFLSGLTSGAGATALAAILVFFL